MSNKSTIKCPNCKTEFPIGDALAGEIEAGIKQRYIERFNKDQKDLEDQRKKLENEVVALKVQQEKQDKIIADKIALQKQQLQQEALKKAAEEVNLRVEAMQKEIEEKSKKIKEAQQKELELLQREKKLKEQEEAIKLELEKKMLEREKEIEEKVKKNESERNDLRIKEYEKRISDQIELIETMKRKAEQGSMQLQGEVQETALEELLKSTFPFDVIEEVGKGVKGADCIQTVRNNFGAACGKIIYESKRTKAFANEWIDKLKTDMRASQASLAVIVTETYPKDMDRFGQREGIWICHFREVKSLAALLRDTLIKISAALTSQENKDDKAQLIYSYVTSNEFKHQIEAIVEGFTNLREGINKERLQMEKLWKEREKQLEKVLLNTTHFYGSVKGIAGNAIGDVKLLELGD
jgi:hypothetical protein